MGTGVARGLPPVGVGRQVGPARGPGRGLLLERGLPLVGVGVGVCASVRACVCVHVVWPLLQPQPAEDEPLDHWPRQLNDLDPAPARLLLVSPPPAAQPIDAQLR